MISILFQFLLSVIAGAALFCMWRRVASSNRWVAWLVTAGVLLRAVGGQIVFWISYLHLPVARSLQLGDGFWIFGLDAMTYFQQATGVAAGGPSGILSASPWFGSVFYVQTLATAILMFGAVEMVGVLLNIAAYLGCCLIALSFGDPAKHRAVVFTIAALSLAPATVMWSLQPMKDTWFMFLVAAFFGAARMWQQTWSAPSTLGRRIAWTLALGAALYGISGIRWYFGLIAVSACLPFFALTILRTKPRAARLGGVAVVVPFLFAAVLIGAGPSMSVVFTFVRPDEPRIVGIPQAFLRYVHYSRAGFERTGGTTMIGAGHAISAVDARLGNREEHVALTSGEPKKIAPEHPKTPAGGAERKPAPLARIASSTPAPPDGASVKVRDASPGTDSKISPPKPSDTRPAVADQKAVLPSKTASTIASTSSAPKSPKVSDDGKPASVTKAGPTTVPIPAAAPVATKAVASASVDQNEVSSNPARKKGALADAKVALSPSSKPASTTVSQSRRGATHDKKRSSEPAPQKIATAAPPATGVTPPPARAPIHSSEGKSINPAEGPAAGTVAIPASHAARFLAGSAAMILPRAIAQRLGILDVRGGRGLWLFVEVDTIAFDAVLVFCLSAVIGAVRRRELRAPVFWLILMVTVVVGGLLAYTVSNFGTLFRHREMVLLGLLLLPLAALPAQGDAPVLAAQDGDDAVSDLPNAVQSA